MVRTSVLWKFQLSFIYYCTWSFWTKCIFGHFGHFLSWIWAKVAPIISSNQTTCLSFHNVRPLLLHGQEWKFQGFWMRRWPASLDFLFFVLFSFFHLSCFFVSALFCCSCWTSSWLTSIWRIPKASLRQKILVMEQPSVVEGNFHLSCIFLTQLIRTL